MSISRGLRSAALAALGVLASCVSPGRPPALAAEVHVWAEGPARWLLLPQEIRQLDRVRSRRELDLFRETFWRRRDADPDHRGNAVRERIEGRIEAADRLYGEAGVRGSLTDRGRALILLGAPPVLRSGRRRSALFRPGRFPAPRAASEAVRFEEWEYPPTSLPPGLLRLLDPAARLRGVTLTFLEGPRHTRLAGSDRALVLAARAIAGEDRR